MLPRGPSMYCLILISSPYTYYLLSSISHSLAFGVGSGAPVVYTHAMRLLLDHARGFSYKIFPLSWPRPRARAWWCDLHHLGTSGLLEVGSYSISGTWVSR